MRRVVSELENETLKLMLKAHLFVVYRLVCLHDLEVHTFAYREIHIEYLDCFC